MFSREKGYKIRVKVHGKGAYFFPNRRAWLPLLKLIAVTGPRRGGLKLRNPNFKKHKQGRRELD